MRDTNMVVIVGRLGRDPKQVSDTLTTFSVAVQDDYYSKKASELVKKTNWLDVAATGYEAKFAREDLRKGMRVCITGQLDQRTWTGEDGQKRSAVQVRVTHVQKLDRLSDYDADKFARDNSDDEDIPF